MNRPFDFNTPLKDLYEQLQSSERGVNPSYASKYLKEHGLNVYKLKHRVNWFTILLSQFKNPIAILLIVVIFISFILGDTLNSAVIFGMILINTVLGFVQEFKAQKSLDKLKTMIKIRVSVLRNGEKKQIDSEKIVPGDVLILNKGSIVPADGRIIKAVNLSINEAPLTGESVEVKKHARDKTFDSQQPQDIDNFLFQGTTITGGSVQLLVTATGRNTILGRSVSESDGNILESNYVKNINRFSRILFYFVIVIVLLVLGINIYLGRGVLESLVLGISLALGITPETMPLIISIALSTAAFKLSKENVLIKRISAFEDFGNVDTICTDKTGTITKGIFEVDAFLDSNGETSKEVLLFAAICNGSNPDIDGKIMENTIDEKIWDTAQKHRLHTATTGYKCIKSWDLDFSSRNVGVLVEKSKDEKLLIVKGAAESVLSMLQKKANIQNYLDLAKEYEENGGKVIALVVKSFGSKDKLPSSREDFADMEMCGFILLKDQPRQDMKKELAKLKSLNISLKILTGDSVYVTKQICDKVDLEIVEDKVILGEELMKAKNKSEKEFSEMIAKYNVFARVDPTQKLEIIGELKKQGKVVAYMGDGINDVGALKMADVGIAVDTAVDVAKDSADIIILDHKLTTVVKGVEEGRKIFANTMKFIFSTMSSSFGNVITIVFASILLKFIPLLPVQVILLDSISDLQHLAISTDRVDKEMVEKPRNWNFRIFVNFVIYWGIISTLFDFFHITVINYFAPSMEVFRTTWLIESVVTEVLATIALRTHMAFFRSRPSNLMIIMSILPLGLLGSLIVSPWARELFGLALPSVTMLFVVFVIVAIYFVALELVKGRYFKKFWSVKGYDI